MNFASSVSSRIGLILCIPLILEVTIFSSSILLLNQIDEARISRQKMGSVSYAYVDTLLSAISDYIGFTAFLSHREIARRDEINDIFKRTNQALQNFGISCRAAGLKYTDIQGPVQREKRRHYGSPRWAPLIPGAKLRDGFSQRHTMLDAINETHNRLGQRIELLRTREDTERRLIGKLNTMLIAALALSLLLTLGLCFLFSKVIIERIAILRSNTYRLSRDLTLLPPLKGTDEIAKLDATFRAMSLALANAKRRDELILKNSIDVICALDRDLKVLRASDSCYSLWNLDSQNIIGKSIADLVSENTTNSTLENFRLALVDSSPRTFENESISEAEKLIPCLWSVQWSEKDELFICVVHDVTERKLAEERRQTLLAIISHDLRSPLTAAKLCIDSLRIETRDDVDVFGKLEVADQSVDYVISVTNDLIDLFRFQQSKLSLKLKLSTLEMFVDSLQTNFSNIRFVALIEKNDSSTCYLTVDDEYLLRVFTALAKQSTLAFDEKAVKITVSQGSDTDIVFAFEPWREKATRKSAEVFDTYQKSSSEITMAFCREIVSNLQGAIVTKEDHQYELHLPSVAVT